MRQGGRERLPVYRQQLAMCRQRGFALLELAIALLIATLLAVFAADRFAQRGRDAVVEGYVAWMASVHHAAQRYIEHNAASWFKSGPAAHIQGFADPRSPTLLELKAAGMLSAGFPLQGMRGLGAHIKLVFSADCPSDLCRVEALVFSDAPLGRDTTRSHNLSAIAHWLSSSSGKGGAVMPERPATIAGAAFSFSNPPVAGMAPLLPGTVAMAVTAEQLESAAYLRVRDERDPQFQGAATVKGSLTTGGVLHVQDHLHIQTQAMLKTACPVEGAIVRDSYAGLLVCHYGQWNSAGGSGGGGYSTNSLAGCVEAAANPVTGSCTCPLDYVPVRIADSTSAVPSEGRTRGYICVG